MIPKDQKIYNLHYDDVSVIQTRIILVLVCLFQSFRLVLFWFKSVCFSHSNLFYFGLSLPVQNEPNDPKRPENI